MNIREINEEIKRLEASKTTYENCNKLAILYTVRDGLTEKPDTQRSFAVAGSSEFLNISMGKDPAKVLQVLDEHMDCIKALYPTEYNILIRRIENL